MSAVDQFKASYNDEIMTGVAKQVCVQPQQSKLPFASYQHVEPTIGNINEANNFCIRFLLTF